MPLTKNVSANISELYHANKGKKKKRSRNQIIAIAMSAAGKSNADKVMAARAKKNKKK
jgi:hypothetical protein